MKSLLLVAHGSRREESNTEIAELADKFRVRAGDRYAHIQHAFLELARPSIPQGIDELVAAGANEIVVLPYFLSAGRHVHDDIPAIIDTACKQHTHVKFVVTPYVGDVSQIMDLLLDIATDTN